MLDDREDLIVHHIHMWAEEVQQHIPCPYESSLVDAGEETGQVLVDQNEVTIDWSGLKNREECVNISRRKVIRARYWDKLENHSGQKVASEAQGREAGRSGVYVDSVPNI